MPNATNTLEENQMSYVAPPPGTTVEIRRTQPHATQSVFERGVIIHSAMTWIVAYFPGSLEKPAAPSDPASIRVLSTGDVIGYLALVDCDPTWVARTWKHLEQASPGLLQAPLVVRVWELAAIIAQHRLDSNVPQLITREQLECWAGRPLTDDDLDQLGEEIPNSSVPDAISTIVAAIDSRSTDA